MPETVCLTVTANDLKSIELRGSTVLGEIGCPACGATLGCKLGRNEEVIYLPVQHKPGCWLGNAIAQAERLKDWEPEVGNLVRLKVMPEAGVWKVLEINEGSLGMKAWLVSTENKRREMQRYLAELMPAEAEWKCDGSGNV